LKKRFLAYDAGFLGGINVSAGDLSVEEIAVGSNSAEAHVTVWSAKSGELLNSFCASGQNDGVQGWRQRAHLCGKLLCGPG
jgi:hypothetical protein